MPASNIIPLIMRLNEVIHERRFMGIPERDHVCQLLIEARQKLIAARGHLESSHYRQKAS